VVEHSPHHPNVKGANPASAEKMAPKKFRNYNIKEVVSRNEQLPILFYFEDQIS